MPVLHIFREKEDQLVLLSITTKEKFSLTLLPRSLPFVIDDEAGILAIQSKRVKLHKS